MSSPPLDLTATLLGHITSGPTVFVVGLDGRSGSGKSTLAAEVSAALGRAGTTATVIDGDGFYTGGTASTWDRRSPSEKADQVIDWRRQHAALTDLRSGRPATWRTFDWESADWDQVPVPLSDVPTVVEPTSVIVLEGAYSCRPELHDVLDLRVLLDAPQPLRRSRLLARDGTDHACDWEGRWSAAEDHYFGSIMPPAAFDLVLQYR